MQITTDEKGFVRCFAYVGNLANSIEVPEPEDFERFLNQFYAFRLQDGHLVYDSEAYEAHVTEETKEEYRHRRGCRWRCVLLPYGMRFAVSWGSCPLR